MDDAKFLRKFGNEDDDSLVMEGGTGVTVSLFTGEDGAPVIQIDTPEDTEYHEEIRVWLNDHLLR